MAVPSNSTAVGFDFLLYVWFYILAVTVAAYFCAAGWEGEQSAVHTSWRQLAASIASYSKELQLCYGQELLEPTGSVYAFPISAWIKQTKLLLETQLLKSLCYLKSAAYFKPKVWGFFFFLMFSLLSCFSLQHPSNEQDWRAAALLSHPILSHPTPLHPARSHPIPLQPDSSTAPSAQQTHGKDEGEFESGSGSTKSCTTEMQGWVGQAVIQSSQAISNTDSHVHVQKKTLLTCSKKLHGAVIATLVP